MSLESVAWNKGSKNKIIIGYPYGGIAPEFCASLTDVLLADRKTQYIDNIIRVGGLYVEANRNIIIEKFLKLDAEWLWFLDTDIVFGPAVMYGMLEKADPIKSPIIAPLYFLPVYGKLTFSWFTGEEPPYDTIEEIKPELNEISACGMGCCLIHRSVLEKMKEYYTDAWTWFGFEELKEYGKILREDLVFCRRARALGFPIYGDGSIIVGHMKSQCLTLSGFKQQQYLEKILNKEKESIEISY